MHHFSDVNTQTISSRFEHLFYIYFIIFIHSSATISAPPTTTSGLGTADPKENGDVKPPVANSCPLVTATGAGSKIVHPPEDVSLEEIKARNAKYRPKPKPEAPAQPPTPTMVAPSTSQAEVS